MEELDKKWAIPEAWRAARYSIGRMFNGEWFVYGRSDVDDWNDVECFNTFEEALAYLNKQTTRY